MDGVRAGHIVLAQSYSGRAALSRRSLVIFAVLVCGAITLPQADAATADTAPSLSDAVGVSAKEQSAAEQYAVILATVDRKDVDSYIRGIQLYADAKAEFDGLIAQLRLDLIDGHDPTKSPKFAAALQAAGKSRIAFTSFVSDQVVGKIQGAKPGLIDVKVELPDLVKSIADAGLGIWDSKGNKERRDAILSEIDRLRWRAFADLAPKENLRWVRC